MPMPSYPEHYSINLSWKCKKLDESQTYIYPCNSEKELCEQFLDPAKRWKEVNPEAAVDIWYDSKTVTTNAVAATQKVAENRSYNVRLRDFREIKIVQDNPDVFSENMPLYFFVDISKLIQLIHSIECDLKQASIFVDLGVAPMSKEELFNPEIKGKLDKVGIQVNEMENQFIQMVNRPETINATKVYINANLSRAVTALNLLHCKLPDFECAVSNLCTVVFEQTRNQLFYLIVAYGNIKVKATLFDPKATEEWVDYDFVKHGCLPLGNYCVKSTEAAYLMRIENDREVVFLGECETKLMQFPESTRKTMQSGIFSRDDVKVRQGNDHTAPPEPLVCPPINGEKYECVYWKISESYLQPKNTRDMEVKETRDCSEPAASNPLTITLIQAQKDLALLGELSNNQPMISAPEQVNNVPQYSVVLEAATDELLKPMDGSLGSSSLTRAHQSRGFSSS